MNPESQEGTLRIINDKTGAIINAGMHPNPPPLL
jgi:hypothetical protein